MSFINKITNYQQASYSGLFVLTHEENRLEAELLTLREQNPQITIHSWDAQKGLVFISGESQTHHPEETRISTTLLEYIQNYKYDNNIFVLKDFHLHFDKVINIRLLRNAWNRLKSRGNMIIFVGHKFAVPAELQKEVQLLDYDLPDAEAILERFNFIKDSVNRTRIDGGKKALEVPASVVEGAVEAAKGMTNVEVENAFAVAWTAVRKFNSSFVDAVFQEKIAQLKKNGLLTYMEPNISFNHVGGMQGLKTWLTSRKKAYAKEARDYSLPLPKGMLLASVPGTGKSNL